MNEITKLSIARPFLSLKTPTIENQEKSPQNPVKNREPAEDKAEKFDNKTDSAHTVTLIFYNNYLMYISFHDIFRF